MEYFYREMRKKYNILIKKNTPIGGKWNYDAENRKPPKEGLTIPAPYMGKIDDITYDVISLFSKYFNDHFGDIEPFYLAVTRTDALKSFGSVYRTTTTSFWKLSGCYDPRRTMDVSLSYQFLSKLWAITSS